MRSLLLIFALLGSSAGPVWAHQGPAVIEYGAKDDGHGAVLLAGLDSRNTPGTVAVTDDGAVWFRETFAWHRRIARIDLRGKLREFYLPELSQSDWFGTNFTAGLPPLVADGNDVLLGPTDTGSDVFDTLSPDGVVSQRAKRGCMVAGPNITCVPGLEPSKNLMLERATSSTIGPDGKIWFTDATDSAIGRIEPSGKITVFSKGLTRYDSGPQFLTTGPDGNLWFTEIRDRVGRITPDGRITEFSDGIPARASLGGILAGCDGNLWFTLYHGMVLGRITAGGAVTQYHDLVYPSDGHGDDPVGMMVRDHQGRLYYNEGQAGRIARVTIPCKSRR
jgi:streptogramin lyase